MQLIEQDNTGKTERINLRVDSFTKKLIEQAAAMDHRSLTGFIIACAKVQAEQILAKEKLIRLNRRDWDNFIAVLSNPPKPNVALKRAFKRYRKANINSDA